MISDTVRDALSEQVNRELASAYLYLSMSSFASYKGLNGVANWLMIQWQEEIEHAEKSFTYVQDQGQHVVCEALGKPPSEFDSVRAMFDMALANEISLSGSINELLNVARDENDNATQVFLQWFVTEQVEEENNARHIIDMLNLAGDEGEGLFLVDKELAQRTAEAG